MHNTSYKSVNASGIHNYKGSNSWEDSIFTDTILFKYWNSKLLYFMSKIQNPNQNFQRTLHNDIY